MGPVKPAVVFGFTADAVVCESWVMIASVFEFADASLAGGFVELLVRLVYPLWSMLLTRN